MMILFRRLQAGRASRLAWFVSLGALLLYIRTSAPGIVELFDDSLELQVVGPTFGIPHPTGYPLYTIVSGLWSRLFFPFGTWAWRVNLLSAIFAGVTVGLIFQLSQRVVSRADGRPDRLAALAAACAFMLSPIWWQQATVAEVYTLHGLFVAMLLTITVGLNKARAVTKQTAITQEPKPTRRFSPMAASSELDRRMALLFFVLGLSLTHHRTILLLVPVIALYILWTVPNIWRPRPIWLLWLLLFMLPQSLYLYLPLRAAAGVRDLHGSYVNSWSGFWNHVLARGYLSFFADTSLARGRDWGEWARIGVQQFGALGSLLACIGLVWLIDRHRRPSPAWLLMLVTGASTVLFARIYLVPDAEVFLIPTFLCAALFIGGGVGLCGRVFAARPLLATILQIVLMIGIVIGVPGRNPNPVNRSQDVSAHAYAYLMAKVFFPPNSHVVGLEGEITALRYMQLAANMAPGVTGVATDDPAERLARIQTLMQAGKPTYVTRELDGLENLYSFSSDGPLVRLWPRGDVDIPQPPLALDLELLDGAMRVEGYDLRRLEVPPGADFLEFVLYWRPLTEISETLKVSLRLLDSENQLIEDARGKPQMFDHFPLQRVARTTTWLPKLPILDTHYLPISSPQRVAQLLVIVYDEASASELARFVVPVPTQPITISMLHAQTFRSPSARWANFLHAIESVP